MNTWLIGAGPHAREYAKVLIRLGVGFDVVGRSVSSVAAFEAETGHAAMAGGLLGALERHPPPETAIVAVSFEGLAAAAIQLIESGAKRILLEKPGGLNVHELAAVAKSAAKHEASVLLAYNRRFYASTIAATRMIAEDGGPTSCNFEFTEWAHTIAPARLSPDTKQAWLLANSSHVIDLAFHICGFPKEWKGWHAGTLDWHSSASRFCGAGVTDKGVLFSYHADWDAPGRWALEVLTRKRRFIFKPMEQLQVTHLASVKVEPVEIDDQIDKDFKPGLYEETRAFLAGDDALFCTAAEQLAHAAIYSAMAGYPDAARGNGSHG
jgi:predicted dehydrogenase